MIMTTANARTRLLDYIDTPGVDPMFIVGDAAMVLRSLPSSVFDCCMTSPPYWGKCEYAEAGIGLENHYRDFIDNLVAVCAEIKRVLGRARELRDKGYYFLRYHPNGSKPSDVWDILPENSQNRKSHFAPYPKDLCRIPIMATCPEGGLVLDPFCGTGTTMAVASDLGRKSVGMYPASI